jgi:tRNA ligase
MGERWLDRHLKKSGKTREALAAKLWNENWTLVAEVSS